MRSSTYRLLFSSLFLSSGYATWAAVTNSQVESTSVRPTGSGPHAAVRAVTQQAAKLVGQLRDDDRRNAVLHDMLVDVLQLGHHEEAVWLCQQLTDWRRPVAELTVAQAASPLYAPQQLKQLEQQVNDRPDWWRPRLQSHLVRAWAEVGQLDQAKTLALSIPDEEESAQARLALVLAYLRAGDIEAAEAVAVAMTENLRYRTHVDKARALARLAVARHVQGDVDLGAEHLERAVELARRTRGWMDARGLSELATAAYRVGQDERRTELMNDAERMVRRIAGPWRAEELIFLATQAQAQGRITDAQRLIEDARASLTDLSTPDRAQQIARVGSLLQQAGDRQQAREFARTLLSEIGELPEAEAAPLRGFQAHALILAEG
jgi:tetratricopeptide (TPR) repeat protein